LINMSTDQIVNLHINNRVKKGRLTIMTRWRSTDAARGGHNGSVEGVRLVRARKTNFRWR